MPKISVLTPSVRPEGLKIVHDCLKEQTFKDFEWLVEINTSGLPDLNSAYNKMIRRAEGELIVSIQDYISFDKQTLQACWDYYQEHKNQFVTFPVSQGEPDKWDWRGYGDIRKVEETDWECDFGMAPKELLVSIGGFDEDLEKWTWGFDNVNVGVRAVLAGYEIWCNPFITANGLPHERETFRDKRRPIFHNERINEFKNGLRLDPLC